MEPLSCLRCPSSDKPRANHLQRAIDARLEAEQHLRETEERYRAIFDTAAVGIVYTDPQGRICEANPAYQRLTGYTLAELQQLHIEQITFEEDLERDALSQQRLYGQGHTHCEKRYVRKDGSLVWVSVDTRLQHDAGGQPVRGVGVVQDIGERRRVQEAERARELAEAATRAKAALLPRIAHELRTPLNAMLGFAQLIALQQSEAPRLHDWNAHILAAGRHLAALVDDLMDLSRLDIGALRLAPQPVNLASLADECLGFVQAEAARCGVTLATPAIDAQLIAHADPTRLRQVLLNLLGNAIKYNRPGGRVWLHAVACRGARLQLRVRDDGLGMNAQQLARLFQPFERLGREHGERPGCGLGLALSRQLAQAMGGELRACSTEGRGTAFVLRLPREPGDPSPAA